MKLTIVCAGKFVAVDGLGYYDLEWPGTPADVHALQWQDNSGWIEYVNSIKPNEQIDQLPGWAIAAKDAWQVKHDEPLPLLPTVEQNADTARMLLSQTSWVNEDYIQHPGPTDYTLKNLDQFVVFRTEVQFILDNVQAGPIEFPAMPEPVWIAPQI